MSALGLALLVLDIMEDIKDDDAYDDGDGLKDISLATRFWVAFGKVTKKRDHMDFVYELVAKLPEICSMT